MTLIGMWRPGKHPVDVEHVFAPARGGQGFVHDELWRIHKTGRTPLMTVEPWEGLPNVHELDLWRWAFEQQAPVYVRYMHEMNGTWYPWGGDPDRFRREWARWTAAMPPNVRNVFCPNVAYPGSHPIADFLPDDRVTVHVVGVDGYARNGETPAELFRPTINPLGVWYDDKPLWVCETAAPRGRKQARFAAALRAFAEQQGIEACVWFNEAKQGLDEADWTLTKGAARALLGRDK